jgi:predicted lipid-binding transport protein (Tim44 family)
MLLGAGAFYYFLKVRRPVPDFSGITPSIAVNGNLLSDPSATTLQTTAVAREVTSADLAAFQQLLTDVQMAWSNQDVARIIHNASATSVNTRL